MLPDDKKRLQTVNSVNPSLRMAALPTNFLQGGGSPQQAAPVAQSQGPSLQSNFDNSQGATDNYTIHPNIEVAQPQNLFVGGLNLGRSPNLTAGAPSDYPKLSFAAQVAESDTRNPYMFFKTNPISSWLVNFGENSLYKPVANTISGSIVEPGRSALAQITGNQAAENAAGERGWNDINNSLLVDIGKGMYHFGKAVTTIPGNTANIIRNEPLTGNTVAGELQKSYLGPLGTVAAKGVSYLGPSYSEQVKQAGYNPEEGLLSTAAKTGLGIPAALYPDAGLRELAPGNTNFLSTSEAASFVKSSDPEAIASTLSKKTGMPEETLGDLSQRIADATSKKEVNQLVNDHVGTLRAIAEADAALASSLSSAQTPQQVQAILEQHYPNLSEAIGEGNAASLADALANTKDPGAVQSIIQKVDELVKDHNNTSVPTEQPTGPTHVPSEPNPELVQQGFTGDTVTHVPTNSLQLGTETISDPLDQAHVARLVQDINEGKPMEPLITTTENGQTFVQDGAHRLEALKQAGVENTPTVPKLDRGTQVAQQAIADNSLRAQATPEAAPAEASAASVENAPTGVAEATNAAADQAQRAPLTPEQEKLIEQFPNGLTAKDIKALEKQGYPPNIIEQLKKQVDEAHAAAKPEQVSENILPTDKPVVSGQSAYDKAIQAGVSEPLAREIQKVANAHAELDVSGSGVSLAKRATGLLQEAKTRAAELQKAIAKELTPEEQVQLRDLAEGHIQPDAATPKVQAVLTALEDINRVAGDTNAALHKVGLVEQYFPREAQAPLRTPEGETYRGGTRQPGVVRNAINQAKDLFGIGDRSPHGVSRQVYKFTTADGEVRYGTPASAGMKEVGDGVFEHGGKEYQIQAAPQAELEANGITSYNKNAAQVLGNYHGDVLGHSYRSQLIEGLKNSSEVVPINEAPEGYVPIKGVPGLEDMAAPKEVVKAINNSPLKYKAPPGIVKAGFNKLNRTIIQTIVANPIFHGGNQEFNAEFSAAWQIDGNKIANMGSIIKDQAELVKNPELRDAVRTDYYSNGGHSPTYGRDYRGFISKTAERVFGENASKVTKVSPNSMAAIEENIRLGIYKTAVENGMSREAAIETIDRVLGGQEVIKDMESSVGLFTHYLKTNVKNVAKSVADVKTGNVSPVAGLALGYGAWYAANKAMQDATGYSLRAPGFVGVINQFASAPGQLKKGRIPSVITNHINPVFSFGTQELTNRDFSKPVFGPSAHYNNINDGTTNNTGDVALRTLFGPGRTVQDVNDGKTSGGDAALAMGLGVYAKPKTPPGEVSVDAQGNVKGSTGNPMIDAIATTKANEAQSTKDFMAGLSKSDKQWFEAKVNGKTVQIGQADLDRAYQEKQISKEDYDYATGLHQALNNITANKTPTTNDPLADAFFKKQVALTAKGKSTWLNGPPDETAKSVAAQVNQQLPQGLIPIQPSNKVSEIYANYQKKMADAAAKGEPWDEFEQRSQARTFWKDIAVQNENENIQDIYKVSNTQLKDYFIKNNKVSREDVMRAISLDDALYNADLIDSPHFSKSFRKAMGVGMPSGYTTASGGGGGGGGSSSTTGKVVFASNPGALSFNQPNVNTVPTYASLSPNTPKVNYWKPTDVTGMPAPGRVVGLRVKRQTVQ